MNGLLFQTVSELQDHIRKNENMIKKVKSQNTQMQEDTVAKLQEYVSFVLFAVFSMLFLIRANETFDQLKRESASEVAVMKANSKKMTIQLESLEKQLQQKVTIQLLLVYQKVTVTFFSSGTRERRADTDM